MIVSLALTLSLVSVSGVSGETNDAEQGVKTTHQALVAAIKSGNVTMAQAFIHPQALGFFRNSQLLVQLNAPFGPAQAISAVLADLGRFGVVPYETIYRVTENTGVVVMFTHLEGKQSQKTKNLSLRSTYVYVSVDGNWKLLSWHTSAPFPAGK